MMKANLIFHYRMRNLAGALLLVAVAGCATQTTQAPMATAPAEAPAESYEQMFETAVKAMDKMGTVLFSNREKGTISGVTPSGVTLEILFVREEGREPQLEVQALLPEGMTGMGDINEPDRYLDIYRKLSRR